MTLDLKGKFLLASPTLDDANFHQAVVLVIHHDENGSMGLIINRLQTIDTKEVFSDLNLDTLFIENTPTHAGGPVEPFRGFVLHRQGTEYDSSTPFTDQITLTTSLDVLEAISLNKGPEPFLLILGYAGWAEGQLEDEIQESDWLIGNINTDILFHISPENRWETCLRELGIDPGQFSSQVGHA